MQILVELSELELNSRGEGEESESKSVLASEAGREALGKLNSATSVQGMYTVCV